MYGSDSRNSGIASSAATSKDANVAVLYSLNTIDLAKIVLTEGAP